MSDFHGIKKKLQEGVDWRGSIAVSIGDDSYDLTVRQLHGPEFEEVMSLIDRSELQQLRESLPQDSLKEYRDLQDQEERDEEDEERLVELEAELEESSVDLFDILSTDTFEGIRRCAKYGVEPDDEDLREAFVDRAAEIESEYGKKVQTPDDVYDPIKKEYADLIDQATNFTAFTIGIQVLVKTVGDEGN